MVIELINSPNDIKSVPFEELPILAEEIRTFLIRNISRHGGHLSSNLGTVELTMALHLLLDLIPLTLKRSIVDTFDQLPLLLI